MLTPAEFSAKLKAVPGFWYAGNALGCVKGRVYGMLFLKA
jgi:hypothetical protein